MNIEYNMAGPESYLKYDLATGAQLLMVSAFGAHYLCDAHKLQLVHVHPVLSAWARCICSKCIMYNDERPVVDVSMSLRSIREDLKCCERCGHYSDRGAAARAPAPVNANWTLKS